MDLLFVNLLTIVYCISLTSSVNATDCPFLYVKPDSFQYAGWFQHATDKKFGASYWYSINNPHIIELLIHQNQWQFYNWNNKEESYELSLQTTNINSIPIESNTTWYFMNDGSQITLNMICSNELNPSIGPTPSIISTLVPHEEQIYWIINNENCHLKPRGYVGLITNSLSNTINAFWDIPILSNHTWNVTISISGNNDEFSIGEHKITYAAEGTQYFIMCQITLYIIANVMEQDLNECIGIENGRIGIINIIVDENTFLMIDIDKYQYEILKNENPIQVLYITPDLIDRDIICYVNINWANIGKEISYSSPETNDNLNSDDFIVWKVLIVTCIILLFGLICERIYFYHEKYKKKYQSVDNMDADLSLNMDDMDPVQMSISQYKRNSGGNTQTRSLSVSAAGSYNNNNNRYSGTNRMSINNEENKRRKRERSHRNQGRAMSMQISSYPFTRPPTKEEFFEQRRRKSSSHSINIDDEIVPLSMNNNAKTIKKRNQRYMSVPTNLMSDNTMKKKKKEKDIKPSVWINDYDDADFWKKELRVLKEAGFENKNKNLALLLKYSIKNEDEVIDKRMTQSVVIRILQKRNSNKKKQDMEAKENEETENFLENEWEENKDNEKSENVVNIEKDESMTSGSNEDKDDKNKNSNNNDNVFV